VYDILPGVSLTRITPPTVPPQFILRKSILEILEKPAPQALIAIAPSGFGKTILAAQWAAMHPDRTIWYTPVLSDSFKDLVFHCVSSLRRFKPDAAPWIEKYRTEKFDSHKAVIEFANEIATIGFDVNFIADGSHNINPENQVFTQQWAELVPENLRTLYTRNNLPPINYARAISIDAFHMLKPIDLAFTDEEVEVLATNYGVDYEKHREIFWNVQNWPAGVLMTIKTLSNSGKAVSADFLDSQMLVASTLNNLDSEIYEIIEQLTYFANISKEQASLILNNASKLQSFERLAAEGIFVRKVGNDGEAFEINELIRNAIKEELKKDSVRTNEIKSKTIEVKINTGRLVAAIKLLEEVGDTKRAKELIALHVRQLLWGSDVDGVLKDIDLISKYLEIGEAGKELTRAFSAMAFGTLEELSVKIKGLEITSRATGIFEKVECDLLVMESRYALGLGNLSKVLELNDSVAKSSKSLFSLRMAANAAFLMEDLDELIKIVEESRTMPPPDPSESTLHQPAIEALFALADGRLQDALDQARYVIEETKRVGATGVWSPYDMVYCAAEVMRETCNEKAAVELIESYSEDVKKFHVTSWQAAFEAKIGLIEAQLGRSTGGLQRIRKIRDELNIPKYHQDLFRVVDEHELVIRALLNDFERVAEIVYRTPTRPTVAIVASVFELRKGGEAAKAALASLTTRNPREKLIFNILLVNVNLERPKVAEEFMEKAMAIVMTHGFKQILLIQSPQFHEFLLKYAATHPTVYMEQIAKTLRDRMATSNSKSGRPENSLTKREIEILNRLSTGLPISQIAANLHISNNTIKTHLKNVYKKLGADCRESAVEKGRELLLF
jgi:ATP/maltotriose-dependent transcriptional regulator MalT